MSSMPARLAALRQCGAGQTDPVHLHYLETLAARAQAQPPQVQRILQAKLERLLGDFQTRLEQAPVTAAIPPPAASASALGELTRHLQHQHQQQQPGHTHHTPPGARTELKSVRQARSTWSRLSADKQLAQALEQAPQNAGPINSHMVVLRSLRLMREVSPDYLNRFLSYVDTLLCLEQTETERPVARRARTR